MTEETNLNNPTNEVISENVGLSANNYTDLYGKIIKPLNFLIDEKRDDGMTSDKIAQGFRMYKLGDNLFCYYVVPSGDEKASEELKLVLTDEQIPFDQNGKLNLADANSSKMVFRFTPDCGDINFYRKGIKEPIAFFSSLSSKDSADWIDVHQVAIEKMENVPHNVRTSDLLLTQVIAAINNGCEEDNFMALNRFLDSVTSIDAMLVDYLNSNRKVVGTLGSPNSPFERMRRKIEENGLPITVRPLHERELPQYTLYDPYDIYLNRSESGKTSGHDDHDEHDSH